LPLTPETEREREREKREKREKRMIDWLIPDAIPEQSGLDE